MAYERLLRLRKQVHQAACETAAEKQRDLADREDRVRAGEALTREAIVNGERHDLAAASLLAEATAQAREAKATAEKHAEAASTQALETRRDMRQIEIVKERIASAEEKRRNAREQEELDEFAARGRGFLMKKAG